MATTTNYGWTTPDDTSLVKDGAAAIRSLGTSIDTTTKNLNPETTLGDLAYRSSTANVKTRLGIGTSGQSLTVVSGLPSWAPSATSVLTTTGDVLYASAANTLARLGIGSAGQFLGISGGVPAWQTPSAGSMTLLSTTATTSGNTISITGISQSYTDLVIIGEDINRAGTADIRIYPRNSTTNLSCVGNYFYHTNSGEIYPFDAIYASNNNGQVTNNSPMYFVWTIYNYASTTREKVFDLTGAFTRSGLSPMRYVGWNVYGLIDSTSAINALNFYSDQAFNAGQIRVFGVN